MTGKIVELSKEQRDRLIDSLVGRCLDIVEELEELDPPDAYIVLGKAAAYLAITQYPRGLEILVAAFRDELDSRIGEK